MRITGPTRSRPNGTVGFEAVPDKPTKASHRDDELRLAIRDILQREGKGMTRKEIWDALPDELRRNEKVFRDAVEGDGSGWRKEDRANREGGPLYHLGD